MDQGIQILSLIPSLNTPLRRCLAVVETVAAVPAASAAMDAEGMIIHNLFLALA